MRKTLTLLALTAVASGCARELEPTSLAESDLQREIFRQADYDENDEEAVQALQAQLLQLHGIISEKHPLDEDARAGAIDPLTAEDLGELPEVPGTELAEQTPTLTYYRSVHPYAEHFAIQQDTNQTCLGSDSTKWAQRAWTENEDCFFDETCVHAAGVSESRTENILANVWIESEFDYHRIKLPLDGGDEIDVLLSRGWMPEISVSDGGGSEWRQRYVLDVWMADGDGTLRSYAFWSEADISGVGDDLYVAQVKGGVEENFENVDAFLSGDVCDDRDTTREDWE